MKPRYAILAVAGLAAVLTLAIIVEPAFAVKDGEDFAKTIFDWFNGALKWLLVLVLAGTAVAAMITRSWPMIIGGFAFALITAWFVFAPESVQNTLKKFAGDL